MARPKELDELTPQEQKNLLDKLIKDQAERQGTGGKS